MENSILRYLKGCDGELYGRIVRTLKVYRGIDFEDIRQEDVMVVSPDKALEYSGEEGDKYFKVWMAGERIAWCTWANTLVDSKFRWNAKARGENKRDNGDLLGNEPYVSAYLKSYDAVKECSTVYMFPFAAFGKKEEEVEEAVEKESKVMEAAKAARVVMTGSEEERAHKERMKQMEMDRKLRQEEMKRARKERERQREREEEMEEERREAEEERRREEAVRAEVKQIMAMQLNDSDPKQLTRELLELSAKIDAINIKDFFNSKTGAALRGKFRSGLIVLKTIDPHNPMIREMEAMQGKWRMKAAFPFILMGVAVVLMLILEKLGIID